MPYDIFLGVLLILLGAYVFNYYSKKLYYWKGYVDGWQACTTEVIKRIKEDPNYDNKTTIADLLN